MNVNGNVSKIETITMTDIPITELMIDNIQQYVIPCFDGNYTLTFNHNGNIKRYQGYGVDNEVLCDFNPKHRKKNMLPSSVYNLQAIEDQDSISYESNQYGDIVSIKYYHNGTIEALSNIQYASKHQPSLFVDQTMHISSWLNDMLFLREDTTFYRYTQYDEYGNWTEMEVDRRSSHMPKQSNVTYRVQRQITYRGEKKKEPLLNQLSRKYSEPSYSHFSHTVPIAKIASFSIPYYMVPYNSIDLKKRSDSIEQAFNDTNIFPYELCRYNYKDDSKFATLAVAYQSNAHIEFNELSQEELEYDEEFDNALRLQCQTANGLDFFKLLKWYPYSCIKIDNHWVVKQRYIRYGIGVWVPVYCEHYTMNSPDGGVLSITTSYQTTHKAYFQKDFTNIIQSFKFN